MVFGFWHSDWRFWIGDGFDMGKISADRRIHLGTTYHTCTYTVFQVRNHPIWELYGYTKSDMTKSARSWAIKWAPRRTSISFNNRNQLTYFNLPVISNFLIGSLSCT